MPIPLRLVGSFIPLLPLEWAYVITPHYGLGLFCSGVENRSNNSFSGGHNKKRGSGWCTQFGSIRKSLLYSCFRVLVFFALGAEESCGDRSLL